MIFTARIVKSVIAALFITTAVAASQEHALETQQRAAAPSVERRRAIAALTLPKDTYELSLDLQEIAIEYGEDQAPNVLMRMFPGKIFVKRYLAPVDGIMTVGEGVQGARFLDINAGTTLFTIRSTRDGSHSGVPREDIVLGRWFVGDGASVRSNDVIVEFYTLTPARKR